MNTTKSFYSRQHVDMATHMLVQMSRTPSFPNDYPMPNPSSNIDFQPTIFPLPSTLSFQFQYLAHSHFQHPSNHIMTPSFSCNSYTVAIVCLLVHFSNIHLITSQHCHFLSKCSAHHSLHSPTSIHPLSVYPFIHFNPFIHLSGPSRQYSCHDANAITITRLISGHFCMHSLQRHIFEG